MEGLDMSGSQGPFRRIYYEEAAADYPLARKLIDRLTGVPRAQVTDYRDVFNRPRQNRPRQESHRSLVLAIKKPPFLYEGGEMLQDSAYPVYRYTPLLHNCLYRCQYCFLRGMHRTGNIVVFVNVAEYLEAVRDLLRRGDSPGAPLEAGEGESGGSQAGGVAESPAGATAPPRLFLALCCETDLLLMESLTGLCREWIQFGRAFRPEELCLEIRTKSANFRAIADLPPHPATLLAWTLTPVPVWRALEPGVPSPESRLRSLSEAAAAGWPVRLCLDPLFVFPGWRAAYSELIASVFDRVPQERIRDVTLGPFRMGRDYYKRMLRSGETGINLPGLAAPDTAGTVSYPPALREELVDHLAGVLRQHLPEERIRQWT